MGRRRTCRFRRRTCFTPQHERTSCSPVLTPTATANSIWPRPSARPWRPPRFAPRGCWNVRDCGPTSTPPSGPVGCTFIIRSRQLALRHRSRRFLLDAIAERPSLPPPRPGAIPAECAECDEIHGLTAARSPNALPGLEAAVSSRQATRGPRWRALACALRHRSVEFLMAIRKFDTPGRIRVGCHPARILSV